MPTSFLRTHIRHAVAHSLGERGDIDSRDANVSFQRRLAAFALATNRAVPKRRLEHAVLALSLAGFGVQCVRHVLLPRSVVLADISRRI